MREQNKHQITSDISTFITEGIDGWQAGFTIGVQTFYLQPVGCEVGDERDTEERAKWYQAALKVAFEKIISKYPSQTEDISHFRGEVIGTIAYDPIRKDLKVTVIPDQAQSVEPGIQQEEGKGDEEERFWKDFVIEYESLQRMEENTWEWNMSILKEKYRITKKP